MQTATTRGLTPLNSSTRASQVPKTANMSEVSLDILSGLVSFYVRTVNLAVSRDLDATVDVEPFAKGTGKIATLLIVGANPGIRPSVVAHMILKDRSAMVRILDHLIQADLIEQKISPVERRARELYLTKKGQAAAQRVRCIAKRQDERFFAMLTAEEQDILRRVLGKVYHSVVASHEVEP